MQCQDNSKLRIPLPEVCDTPDIGCVPITFGKPDCAPQPDQIPFAFDPKTTTLWIYNCRTHEWLEFRKFRLCNDLIEVNVDNLANICELLQIPVFFNAGNGCQEGWITLQEFADHIKKCFHLKWRAVCLDVTEGEEGTLKIDIQNFEDALPPWYIKFKNIWPICGTGEEDDPVILETYDPICEWPTKTFEDVRVARVKHLGACLDGEMVRVPFPPPPCTYPQYTREQVENAQDKDIIMCVDNRHVKVQVPPAFFLPPPCWFPQITREEVESAQDKDIIMCVDGRHVKIQVPPAFFLPPPCWFPQFTRAQVDNGRDKDIIICVDGQHAKIPVPPAFFVPEYICVPEVTETPSQPPAEGTGPIRVDCDGNIYFWLCDTQIWFKVHTGIKDIDRVPEIETEIANKCDDVAFKTWVTVGGETTKKEASLTLGELAQLIFECVTADEDPDDCDFGSSFNRWLMRTVGAEAITGAGGGGDFHYESLDRKDFVVSSRDGAVIMGSAKMKGKAPGGSPWVDVKNTSCIPRTYMLLTKMRAKRSYVWRDNYSIGLQGIVSFDKGEGQYKHEVATSAYGIYKEMSASQGTSKSCEKRVEEGYNLNGLPLCVGTSQFQVRLFQGLVNGYISSGFLPKGQGKNGYQMNKDGTQDINDVVRAINYNFFTLPPGAHRRATMDVTYSITDIAADTVRFNCANNIAAFSVNTRVEAADSEDSPDAD